jgi:hypothetical protein
MTTTLKDMLNKANINELADLLKAAGLGDLARALPVHLYHQAPIAGGTANYNLTTEDIIQLPPDAKAAFIFRATGRDGGTVDEFTPQAYGVTPATTQCGVSPCGDIAFIHATDAVTDVDVAYLPMKGDVVEGTFTVSTGVLTLPKAWTDAGVSLLMEAEALTGTITGKKIVLVPLAGGGAGLPATTKAQLTSKKTTVSFNNATDAVTSARVKCLIGPSLNLNALLGAAATF